MKKRVFSLIMAFILVMFLFPQIYVKADVSAHGECGKKATWELQNGVLTIQGSGTMSYSSQNVPWYLYRDSIRKVVIENGITKIFGLAFQSCTNLVEVSIAPSVKEIGHNAFASCTSLKEIHFPDGIKTLEGGMFKNCSSLEIIDLPDSITSIGSLVFQGVGKGEFRMPASVKKLEDHAFALSGFSHIYFSDKLEEIEEFAFSECNNLEWIEVGSGNPFYASKDGVLFSKDMTVLLQFPINSTIKDYTVPYTVQKLGIRSLSDNKLNSIMFPLGLTEIGPYALSHSVNIKEFVLPRSVKTLGENCFLNCYQVKKISVNGPITIIPQGAFAGCGSLWSINLPGTLNWISYGAFMRCYELSEVCFGEDRQHWNRVTIFEAVGCHSGGKLDVPQDVTIYYNSYNPFTDVSRGASYYNAMLWAKDNGILSGTDINTMSPDAKVTREQFAAMLWKLNGKPAPAASANPFTDVPSDSPFLKPIRWCYQQGIVAGTSATTFSPKTNINRWQIMVMLWRMCGKPEASGTNPFTDVKESASYYNAVLWAYRNSITSAKTFKPGEKCPRWQLVVFLYKLNQTYHFV